MPFSKFHTHNVYDTLPRSDKSQVLRSKRRVLWRRFLCPNDGLILALRRNYPTSAVCPFPVRALSQQVCCCTPLCSRASLSVPDILNLYPGIIVKLLLNRFTDITLYSLHTQVFRNHLHKVSVMSLSFIIHSEKGVRFWYMKFLRLWLKWLQLSRKWRCLGNNVFKSRAASILRVPWLFEAELEKVWSSEMYSFK